MTLYELCEKHVVNVSTGEDWGRVDDLEFSPDTAAVTQLLIYGKPRLFGLFGRGEDRRIDWNRIRAIGTDVVLVEVGTPDTETAKRAPAFWKFGNA